ncbi:MAG: hypothetical protein GXP24_14715 [Planctomycetes bacterium]|nr:hypothetical protein [Planctomycetota bacterium]
MLSKLQYAKLLIGLALIGLGTSSTDAQDTSPQPTFNVGYAKRDITPQAPMPMWGYGDRHDMLSEGTLHPLFAKAIVIQAGDDKLAIVGLDLGRGPTRAMTEKIREEISKQAGIKHVMISGSHTHHGPCIELLDHEGFGKGKFDAAVVYNKKLPDLIVQAILAADENAQAARIGVTSKDVAFNRNRHTKRRPKVVDPMLAIMRFDAASGDQAGKPIAVLVNYAAHPVMTQGEILKFSADYPGFLEDKVESELNAGCVFMQGAAGDMSTNPPAGVHGPQAYGELLADHVLEMAAATETTVPEKPSIRGRVDRFRFPSRVDYSNPLVVFSYSQAFFPELIRCFTKEMQNGVPPELNTILLNKQIALVGGSGEFFCNHANRLKERSYVDHTLFFGYCNDHYLYFPTIEAVSEGGYGASSPVSPVAVGAGEQMMNQALINIYTMLGKIAAETPTQPATEEKGSTADEFPVRVDCEGLYPIHLQGVCLDEEKNIFWSFTTWLVKTDSHGKLIKKIPVDNHHGDLCFDNGKIYVAVNLGKFNDPAGNADSWVYVYEAKNLKELARHEVQQVKYGAGGIATHNGRFLVVGGLPQEIEENYLYEYDSEFNFLKQHTLASGHTDVGIQGAAYAEGTWWFACYGTQLLTATADLQMQGRYTFDCGLGIVGLGQNRFYVARGKCEKGKGCHGYLLRAVPNDDSGLKVLAD